MASTGEAGRFRFVAGLLLVLVAGLGPVAWDALLHREDSGIPGYDYATAEPLTGWDDPRLARRDGEPVLTYVRRATRAVDAAVYHCEPTERQTWATDLLAVASSGAFPGSEGVIHPAALRCGFCSQVSAVLSRALRDNGVPSARPREIDGHVVVTFRHAGREYVADPDYGVGPWAVDWSNPAATAATVRAVYGGHPVPAADTLPAMFAETGTDLIYSPDRLDRIAGLQGAAVAVAHSLRWGLVGVAVLLLTPITPTRSRAAKRESLGLSLRR